MSEIAPSTSSSPLDTPRKLQVPLVLVRMQDMVDSWQAATDARSIFLNCYLLMTRNMLAAINAGEFHDAEWAGRLLHRFAEYYFDAAVAYDKDPASASAVWRTTFHAAAQTRLSVIQNLLLGINAHINYDLVLALAEILRDEWPTLSQEQRLARYADHCHVNEVIASTIDAVQDQVIGPLAPSFSLVDLLFGPADEWIAKQLIVRWRDTVWHNALGILACSGLDERETLRIAVEDLALRRAHALLETQNLTLLGELL